MEPPSRPAYIKCTKYRSALHANLTMTATNFLTWRRDCDASGLGDNFDNFDLRTSWKVPCPESDSVVKMV